MTRALLPDRGVIAISGQDSESFLENLLTQSVFQLSSGEARFAALLTPQGKIIADGFVVRAGNGFLFDCPKALVHDMIRKLTLYRLRANLVISDLTAERDVIAGWDEDTPQVSDANIAFTDPRYANLGWRMIAEKGSVVTLTDRASAEEYRTHRVICGIPEGGKDFPYSETFPHEADMDQLGGIDFKKGCYVGQEVVSRMQHRGLARTRAVPVLFADGIAPPDGTAAEAQGKLIGTIGSHAPGGRAIAILRLDRVEEALAAGAPLAAGGLAFSLETRPWIGFSVPRN